MIHLAIVGPGIMPIPPPGWGAVESLIWDHKCYLEKLYPEKIKIDIINTPEVHQIVRVIEDIKPDIVHIHYDVFWQISNCLSLPPHRIIISSHYGYIDNPSVWFAGYYPIFQGFLDSKANIHCLSTSIEELYKKNGVKEDRLFVLPNGVNADRFHFTPQSKYPMRSIYLGKIEVRKGQYKYQSIKSIDFVGNYQDSPFDTRLSTYLGHWDRAQVYAHLTDYANLVLLSVGEAHSLVCCEALVAGIGLVISSSCTANLDTTLPFITVIPDDKLEDIAYVEREIEKNREVSCSMREQIREYGLTHFSYDHIVRRYYEYLTSLTKE